MTKIGKIAIIADDYTGAGDAGIHFARIGRKVELLLHADALDRHAAENADVSLTSETRFLAPGPAAAIVGDLTRRCKAAGYARIFKKIDSTMRGNPGAEIEAALAATGQAAALICTAMPKTGRTCRDGAIYLDGVPLNRTDIGRDPFHPLASARVADLLGLQTSLPIGFLGLRDAEANDAALRTTILAMIGRGVRLIVADAIEERHLASLARQLSAGDLLPVGAGGFAEAFAGTIGRNGDAARPIVLNRPIVSVVGSLADISRRQAEFAERSGLYRTVEIRADAGADDIRATCAARLSPGDGDNGRPNVLLRVVRGEDDDKITKESGERVAEKLGLATARICDLVDCRTIVSTGGSTSMAVAEALGIESVDLVDEILPGVVVGACNRPNGDVAWFISKAGGFGDESLFAEIDARCR